MARRKQAAKKVAKAKSKAARAKTTAKTASKKVVKLVKKSSNGNGLPRPSSKAWGHLSSNPGNLCSVQDPLASPQRGLESELTAGLENQLLYPPIQQFGHVEFSLRRTRDFVNPTELLELFT